MVFLLATMSLYEHEQLVRLVGDNLEILIPALFLGVVVTALHSQEIDRYMHPEDYELG